MWKSCAFKYYWTSFVLGRYSLLQLMHVLLVIIRVLMFYIQFIHKKYELVCFPFPPKTDRWKLVAALRVPAFDDFYFYFILFCFKYLFSFFGIKSENSDLSKICLKMIIFIGWKRFWLVLSLDFNICHILYVTQWRTS